MGNLFSDRIADVPRSFIREILKVALEPSMISFAGGLPNREFFPAEEIRAATDKVYESCGRDIFQYASSEGDRNLREWIAGRYRRQGLDVAVDNILITSGSQQGLDLLGKTLLDDGDGLIIEEPGYLGAIQAFSIYRPEFLPVVLNDQGMDAEMLQQTISGNQPKLMYTVPNFQNPSGITYTNANRAHLAEILRTTDILLVEDDPYGDLRFIGKRQESFYNMLPGQTILLGSFSKIIVPGFRLGWLVAPGHILDKLIIAKQATDLHTSHFTQAIIHRYLVDNDVDALINSITRAYGAQCQAMLDAIESEFPASVRHTRPEGGMFLWAELPQGMTALELFDHAIENKVIFVPGDPFFIGQTGTRSLRLNFSSVDIDTIRRGIKLLGNSINELIESKGLRA